MKAVLLVSHGSRSPRSREENLDLARKLQEKSGLAHVEAAFLEADRPSIPEGIESCLKKGASEIVILLNFLNSGRHVTEDIPALVEEARLKYPAVIFSMTPPVGTHPEIVNLFLDWIEKHKVRG